VKKPEYMTCLSGNRLVHKSCSRIAFRGVIDSLEAHVLEAQALAADLGEQWYCDRLGEVLKVLREILAAEVKETPLPPINLFGCSEDKIHSQSHDVAAAFGFEHPLPDYTMGALPLRLNTLRTKIREAELLAVRTFCGDTGSQDGAGGSIINNENAGGGWQYDIIRALNRLSSALYWLFCKTITTPGR
jgi:ethanolamine utilization cobalamin adenosyltransferase